MTTKLGLSKPELIYQGDKLTSVSIRVSDYKRILTRLQDKCGLAWLNRHLRMPSHFQTLDEYLDRPERGRAARSTKTRVG